MATQEVELTPVEEENNVQKDAMNSPVLEVNCIVENDASSTPESQAKPEGKTETEQTEESVKNGVNNPVFMQDEGLIEESIPALTYVDFLPTQTHPELKTTNPFYSSFRY